MAAGGGLVAAGGLFAGMALAHLVHKATGLPLWASYGVIGGAAAAGGRVRLRPLLLARYYVATTAALGAGLHDHLRHGTPAVWEAAEGTR